MELEYQIHVLTVSYQKKSENNKGLVLGAGYSCQAAARFIGQPLAGFIFLNFGKNVPFYFDAAFLVMVALGYIFLFKNIKKTGLNLH